MPIEVLEDQDSISAAWLGALSYLKVQPDRKCYNLAYMITRPDLKTVQDEAVMATLDHFSKAAGVHPVTTVANTIFPSSSYRRGGATAIFETYVRDIYPKVKTGWGTYIERMVRRTDAKGKVLLDRHGQPINPLKSLTAKVKKRVSSSAGTTTHYELPVSDEVFEISTYDPARDGNYPRGGPCLSHLSFKVGPASALRLTAFYRSHFYLERALGNLMGLAQLQKFVASEAGCTTGPLTLIASEARLEGSLGNAKAAEVRAFLTSLGV